MKIFGSVAGCMLAFALFACSDNDSSGGTGGACSANSCGGCQTCMERCRCETGGLEGCSTACGVGSGGTSGAGATGGAGGASGSAASTGGSGASAAGGSGAGGSGAGGSGTGGADTGGTAGVAGSGGSGGSVDPNAVAIPGVACGSVLDETLQTPFVDIGGRQVYIDYACNEPRGTAVTFILNLHGTMDQEGGKVYIRNYLSTYKFAESHNLIVATPKSVVSQWGNGDGGRDEPHLLAVVDWMYTTFSDFDIQQMWIVGHSWGAMYARSFACRAEFTDKIKGVVLMSGGSSMPACADRLAALGTVGETDIVAGELTQGSAASRHSCAPQQTSTLGNNVITAWPSCSPGWVHKNYFMLGKGHGFVPADWPDEEMNADMVEALVSTR